MKTMMKQNGVNAPPVCKINIPIVTLVTLIRGCIDNEALAV